MPPRVRGARVTDAGPRPGAMPFSPSSKGRLTERDLPRFSGQTLFDHLARAVCAAGCVPRKELYEAWHIARRVRRIFRGGAVLDVGAGHGLLAHVLLILDDSSPEARVVDRVLPPSSAKLHAALAGRWPRLRERVTFVRSDLDNVAIAPGDLVVSSHACGALTDRVIARTIAARARLAVLPCCHDLQTCDPGAFSGWMDGPTAIDVMRVVRLEQHDYRVWTQMIPEAITPKNRLLLASPQHTSP